MEWKLFPDGTIPEFTTTEFFENHGWVPPGHQLGHAQRMKMVADLVRRVYAVYGFASLSDIGCGDGSLLSMVVDLPVPMWGYDAGAENVQIAATNQIAVWQADILRDPLDYGELIVATEVIEHLVDPHGFVAGLPGNKLILSSPSAETGDWHYEHHSWAWDLDGYALLAIEAGWTVHWHVDCPAEVNHHGGQTREQRFQAIYATREAQ